MDKHMKGMDLATASAILDSKTCGSKKKLKKHKPKG